MILKVNRTRSRGVVREGITLALVVGAIVGISWQLGALSERRKWEATLSAERIQHQRTAQDLRELQADVRIPQLCAHIRRHMTDVPEVCR